MNRRFARVVLPALALGTSLSGCAYIIDDLTEVEGVALAELDTGGDAPTHIRLNGPDDIIITTGDTWSVTAEGDGGATEALRFDLDGDRLAIARDSDVFDGRGSAIVRITMPAPNELTIAGSGSITSEEMASAAVIDIKGSGDISIGSITADELEIDIKGSGGVTASGSAKRLEIDIKGRGDVALEELKADDAEIDIKGSGNVRFASDGTVNADIKGSGDIVVTGDAKCSMDKKGSGSLTCTPVQNAEAKTEGAAPAE